eukprot:1160451-Pelagomonas_calceolata.AAC.1
MQAAAHPAASAGRARSACRASGGTDAGAWADHDYLAFLYTFQACGALRLAIDESCETGLMRTLCIGNAKSAVLRLRIWGW